jgi:thiamine-monophosphate kinase
MEKEFLRWLTHSVPADERIPLGIGDDAAILAGCEDGVVVAVDMLVEGVHFHFNDATVPGYATPYQVGRKALAVNLSDLAAMAAEPTAALVAVAANSKRSEHDLQAIYGGLLDLAKRHKTPIIGGDTNGTDGPLTISVTVLGRVANPWLRSGASSDDELWVTGRLGGSLLSRHLHFEPRLEEAAWLRERKGISAAMDISDGLSVDLPRLAEASQCGAAVLAEQIPIATDANILSKLDGRSPLDHALNDGEDFELLLALRSGDAASIRRDWPFSTELTRIGQLQHAERGIEIVDRSGRRPLEAFGYLHD